jgi:hypothetical protein
MAVLRFPVVHGSHLVLYNLPYPITLQETQFHLLTQRLKTASRKTMKNLKIWLCILIAARFFFQTFDAGVSGDLGTGQTVYVSLYSHSYQEDAESPVNLAVILSIRNEDPRRPIPVLSTDQCVNALSFQNRRPETPSTARGTGKWLKTAPMNRLGTLQAMNGCYT